MPSKFIALPVGRGDSFYLERDNFHMLVDGGQSKTAITPLMESICNAPKLDIVVCTHNDSDHANGIIGLLENWEKPIHEVWLPGSWTYRLKDLITEPGVFYDDLVDSIHHSNCIDLDRYFGNNDEENHNTQLKNNKKNRDQDNSNKRQDRTFYLEDLVTYSKSEEDSSLEYASYAMRELLCSIEYRIKKICPLTYQKFMLLDDALQTAGRIKAIVQLAMKHGCKIRFFEHSKDKDPKGGIPDKLVPVNSRELVRLKNKEINTLYYLALTKANRESLVFYSPETETDPSVLFTADSDLANTQNFFINYKNLLASPIVTSPHHGSDSNKLAYTIVSDWLKNNQEPALWVRSDFRSKRPGNSYKSQLRRFCTLCNRNKNALVVIIKSSAFNWQVASARQACICR